MDLFKEISIDGINYEIDRMEDLNYTIKKMYEYIDKVGLEKSIRSQKFIRHMHICVALKLNKIVGISKENIHFEVKLRNKNIDIGVIEDNKIKLAISVRSQNSSIKNNFTNNINSLQGEVVGLKSLYPDIKTGVVYLFKINDLTTNVNCLDYYAANIPKKLLPIIAGNNLMTKDRFDTGCVIICDYDKDKDELIYEENDITKAFSMANFINEINDLYKETEITSQFSAAELDSTKIIEFLGSN